MDRARELTATDNSWGSEELTGFGPDFTLTLTVAVGSRWRQFHTTCQEFLGWSLDL